MFRLLNPAELSSGTGYLVNGQGDVVTNFHVVKGATKMLVLRPGPAGNVAVEAEIISTDRERDMAVVRAPGLVGEPLKIGTTEVAKGQKVFALGFPGLADLRKARSRDEFVDIVRNDPNYTVSSHTNGDVSRVVRESWATNTRLLDIVQHTVPIRPGNSGGPLLDLCGNVVGMNTAGVSQAGSVPVHLASAGSEIAAFLDQGGTPYVATATSCADGPAPPAAPTQLSDSSATGDEEGERLLLYGVIAAALVFVVIFAAAMLRSGRGATASPEGGRRIGRRILLFGVARRSPAPRLDAHELSGAGGSESVASLRRAWRIKFEGPGGKVGMMFDGADLAKGIVVGRARPAGFVVDETGVSRRHARFAGTAERPTIEDLGSTNGTFVNGRRLEAGGAFTLRDGDEIRIGPVTGRLSGDRFG